MILQKISKIVNNNRNKIKINIINTYLLMFEAQQSTRTSSHNNNHEGQSNKKQVSIYLRQANKFGKKITISNKIKVQEIMNIAQSLFLIPIKQQIVYFASKKYTHEDESILQLTQGSIVHIHNLQKYHLKELKLYFQEITSQGSITKANQFNVKADQKISNFVQRCLLSIQVTLIESGRKLNVQSTFQQSQIEDGANISYFYKQKQLNHDQFEKDFNKLFQQQQEVQQGKTNQVKSQGIIKSKQQQYKNKKQSSRIQFDKNSSDQMESFTLQPDFKKKKTICLKAVKKNPQDPNYIWKRDISFSESKCNNNKPLQVLKGKKKSHKEVKITQNSASDQKMTINERIKLRQQFKKLFMSENLGLRGMQKPKVSNFYGDEGCNYPLNEKKEKEVSEPLSDSIAF